jgi:pyruvate dehydrogenase E2 component (dihydrolipoamide acetyltransferase)
MSLSRIHAVTMPKWGMTMGGGALVSWLVAEGASVEPGTEVAEVETTKTAGPIESGRAGILRRQVARVGSALPVGGLIGVISDPDVPDSEIAEFIAMHAVDAEPGTADASPASRSVATASGRFNVLDAGEGAPAFLLIHGFGGALEGWSLLQDELARARRAIAFDLPGHGDSSVALADWSLEGLSRSLIELMDALELPSAHLVAHSLGGAIAILAAAAAPKRVLSLTLLASAGLGPEIDDAYVRDFIAATRRKDLAPVVAKLFADPRLASKTMVEQILRMKRIDGTGPALAGIARAAFPDGRQARSDLAAVLAATDVPAQAIWGQEDRIIPAAHASRVGAHIVLPETGHMPQIEKAGEVARIVRDFASRHEVPH